MQNQIINYNLIDNSVDNFVFVTPTKQQIFSTPKEESQVIPGQTYNFSDTIPVGYLNDPANQTENRAEYISGVVAAAAASTPSLSAEIIINGVYGISSVFEINGLSDATGNVSMSGNIGYIFDNTSIVLSGTRTATTINLNGNVSNGDTLILSASISSSGSVIFGAVSISSGATFSIGGTITPILVNINPELDRELQAPFMPTDYIGMTNYDVPYLVNETFANIVLYNGTTTTSFYSTTGNFTNIISGIQLMKIPANCFAVMPLTTPITYTYSNYYITVAPKFIQTYITAVLPREQFAVENMGDNEVATGTPPILLPLHVRRTIYSCSNTDFMGTPWSFEGSPWQAGRLYGSVVEVWNNSGSTLKQIKIMNENYFNFPGGSIMNFVLSPDNVGYDPVTQDIVLGDMIKIYPRETYFNQFTVNVGFSDESKSVKAALQFMMNDVARDMTTAIYEVYDDNGLSIDPVTGLIDGNVIQSYQITQYGQFEIRKKITNG